MIDWQNDPDGYHVETLTTTGAVLAIAQCDATGPVQWFSRWIAEGGHANSAVLAIDGHTARVIQGENAGQGLLVIWAMMDGIASNELVLMLLGGGEGNASTPHADTDTSTPHKTDTDNSSRVNDCTLRGKATLHLAASAALSIIKVFRVLPMKAKATLRFISRGILNARKGMRAKAVLRFIARHKTAQPPSGLTMKMKIFIDPFRPDVIRDQYLLIWFNGHPNHCRIALKIDDDAEFQPAFIWQNPGNTAPAIVKIDSAEIPSDGQTHRITVSVWQQVGNQTSARATLSDFAKTPNIRPPTQPEWCGATSIRQGETIKGKVDGYTRTIGHISDLTRINWRHTGAVQLMARIPVLKKGNQYALQDCIIGYADHNETTFYVENIGEKISGAGGILHDVLFGVAAIQNGTFGPVTWANAPVKIREVHPDPYTPDSNPDAATARVLYLDWMKEEIGKALFTENGWTYPGYGSPAADIKRRDTIHQAIDKTLRRIKETTRQGGNVTLDDLGRFEARWNPERTLRSVGFVASPGFIEGTKRGITITDQQAKAMP